jgi:peptidoglycan/LPS O-acetylase OafA/YrhL
MAIVVLCGTVIIAGAFSNTAVARFLRAPPLVWLGTISYSLYMVHAPIRMTIGKAAESAIAHTGSPAIAWLVAALMFAVTIALAAILYSWVERPARRWIRRSIADALAIDRPPGAASARAVP